MEPYDVIVVGAGPAGSSAALAASSKGARTILLEEHPAVGYPRHCTGRIHGTSFSQGILTSMGRHILVAECRSRRYFSPGGKLILDSPLPPRTVYMIAREEFDRELAKQAVQAGALLVLNTGVTGLIRERGKIRGVMSNAKDLPRIYGRIVIVAQGAKGRANGIPRMEGLSNTDETFEAGIMVELTGVRDIEPGVFETFFGAMTPRGYINLWPHGSHSCFMSGNKSLRALDALKQGRYLVCKKIREAVPVQIHPHILGSKGGVMLPRLVKNGMMLVGDSAGFNGFMHAVVSGRLAGEVAAEAALQGDVSEPKLKRYQRTCAAVGLPLTIGSWDKLTKLTGMSDDAIEAVLPAMLAGNEVEYRDLLPF